jgi:hypothetical protein
MQADSSAKCSAAGRRLVVWPAVENQPTDVRKKDSIMAISKKPTTPVSKTPAPAARPAPAIQSKGPAPSTTRPTASVGAVSSTPVRNSAVPKGGSSRRDVSHEQIAKRAYEISQSGNGGSPEDNWLRAERELRGL